MKLRDPHAVKDKAAGFAASRRNSSSAVRPPESAGSADERAHHRRLHLTIRVRRAGVARRAWRLPFRVADCRGRGTGSRREHPRGLFGLPETAPEPASRSRAIFAARPRPCERGYRDTHHVVPGLRTGAFRPVCASVRSLIWQRIRRSVHGFRGVQPYWRKRFGNLLQQDAWYCRCAPVIRGDDADRMGARMKPVCEFLAPLAVLALIAAANLGLIVLVRSL